MAPNTRDKWVRRFIIPETTRHKKGFTIYKVTSVVFLKSSHEEISKVSVWKRYNDFKKLHSELNALCSKSQIKESFPSFPKPKFFGRFEAEVIEERRECALKFLEFIGRHSHLYSSDTFIKFFETSHADYCLNDCSQSVSSDTSAEDDRHACINSLPTDNAVSQSILQPKRIEAPLTDSTSILSTSTSKSNRKQGEEGNKSEELQSVQSNDTRNKIECEQTFMGNDVTSHLLAKDTTLKKIISNLDDNQLICSKNNNCYKGTHLNVIDEEDSILVETPKSSAKTSIEGLNFSTSALDGSDLPQSCTDSSQYILVAAAHMSAAFRHEDLTEYEEAFTQYKMGISSLKSGVESDSNRVRAEIIKEKMAKYLERAEKLYNRYLNCNISLLSKPVSELQHFKVLKMIDSVMLVKDVRRDCFNIVKAIEKFSTNNENVSNYILRGQVPYMVQLHACVETETTVFLILQHLSRGKLWDFIVSRYKSNNGKVCGKIILENGTANDKAVDDNSIILRNIKYEIEGTESSVEDLNLTSTNSKVQMEMHSATVEENCGKFSDVTTTQLLEKAQILLQSVNATLKESNSVVNRLRDSDHLTSREDNTALLNLRNSVHQSANWTEVSVDINEISLEFDSINRNTTIEKIPDENVMLYNYLSLNDVKNTNGQCSTDDSSLSGSCKDLSSDEKESTNSSIENLKTVDTHFATDHDNRTGYITDNCELNGYTTKIDNRIETNHCYALGNQKIQYTYATNLMKSTKNNNIDVEEELWKIPENVIRLWAAEILLALEALHHQEVIVFDLKPGNILLDDNGHVQLTYIIPNHDVDLLKYKHPYSSPELCMYSPMVPLTSATDIWSYGVILYELIAGNRFQAKHPNVFHSHSIINIPNKLSESAKSLLLNTLKYQPDERMTIPEIKRHPFFKDINWASLADII